MRTAAVILVSLLTLAGCKKEGDYSQATPPKTTTTTTDARNVAPENSSSMNPIVPPQASVPGSRPAVAAAPEAQVDLLEYSIHMQPSYAAGSQTFAVANAGKENHGLVIEGNGTQVKLANELTRGDRSTLTVELKPGTYTAWCPVDGHKGKGMTTTFTVR
jgi:plastocyanin